MSGDLRPLSLGELLDRTFFLYRKNFMLFAGIMALPHVVLLAFQLITVALRAKTALTGPGIGLLFVVATLCISMGAVAVSHGGTVVAVSQVHLGRRATITESFARIKHRILSLSLIMIGLSVGIGIGFVLLIVPGIILTLMWALTIPVAVLEDKGLSDSVRRSAELTKGHRGRVFVIYLIFFVIFYAVWAAWEIPLLAIAGVMMRNHGAIGLPVWTEIAIPLGTFLSQCMVGPLMTIGFSLLYYDERVRKEAFDLQHMMATLDATQGETMPAVSV
jgi:hypothetical protein